MTLPSPASFRIADLRAHPGFVATVADRVWNAWWREAGIPLEAVASRLDESLVGEGVPLTLVAHRDGVFLGTASVIASDMDERPHYTPWVAAVWVDAEHRQAGVGSALVNEAAQAALA